MCVQVPPNRTHTRELFLAAHATCDYIPCHVFVECFSTTFLPIFSSPTATPTPLNGIRIHLSVPLHCEVECLAIWPIRLQTQVMSPNSASMSVASTHRSTSPTRNMCFQQEYDAMIATTEDLGAPRQSGASSSSKHTAAASRVPTVSKLGSFSRKCWRIMILLTVGLASGKPVET